MSIRKNKKHLDFQDLLDYIQKSQKYRKTPYKFVPHCYYNRDGDQIEAYKEDTQYYAEYIDHNLTLFRKMFEPNKDKIIGYEITSIFGLFAKTFGIKFAYKIMKEIKEYNKKSHRRIKRYG